MGLKVSGTSGCLGCHVASRRTLGNNNNGTWQTSHPVSYPVSWITHPNDYILHDSPIFLDIEHCCPLHHSIRDPYTLTRVRLASHSF